jgi:hypothetical protein
MISLVGLDERQAMKGSGLLRILRLGCHSSGLLFFGSD